jgi:hypothetical protein
VAASSCPQVIQAKQKGTMKKPSTPGRKVAQSRGTPTRREPSTERASKKWDGNSDDALLLKALIRGGAIDGMKPAQVRARHPVFADYDRDAFQHNLRRYRIDAGKAGAGVQSK